MGMYTGIRADLVVRPEMRPVIEALTNVHDDGMDPYWGIVADMFPEYEWLRKFSEDDRAYFIPYGCPAYMPDDWCTIVPGNKGGDEGPLSFYDRENGRWVFACALKNYDDTIDKFLGTVLPRLAESVTLCETFYEEDQYATAYEFVAGEKPVMKESARPGTPFCDSRW